jgi:hypothetical protein
MADGPHTCLHTWRYTDLQRLILRCTHCGTEQDAATLACKHDWYFTDNTTLAMRCRRCNTEVGPRTTEPDKTMSLFDD